MAYRTQIKSGEFKPYQETWSSVPSKQVPKKSKICQPSDLHLSPQTPTMLALRGQHGLRPDGELDLSHSFLGICQKRYQTDPQARPCGGYGRSCYLLGCQSKSAENSRMSMETRPGCPTNQRTGKLRSTKGR